MDASGKERGLALLAANLTPDGWRAVETLELGDHVVVADGDPMPVVWLGCRRLDCRLLAHPERAWPIRVSAHALGRGEPRRDVWLSPDHAVLVDGVLIPVKHLVDDKTIVRVPREHISYWHVELPRHAVLFADGLPVGSYLDIGNRADLSVVGRRGRAAVLRHPSAQDACRVWEAHGCAPLVLTGPELASARRRLAAHAIRVIPQSAAAPGRSAAGTCDR